MTRSLYFETPSSFRKYGGELASLDVRKGNRNWFILRAVGTGKTVLDVGCGPGLVGEALIKNRNVVHGIEPDSEAADEALRRGYRSVFKGPFDKFHSDTRFDVVLFADVLEHLERPDIALVRSRQFCGDFIVVSIPNIAYYRSRISLMLGRFTYQEIGLLDKTHLRFFTLESFNDLLEASGYRMIDAYSQRLTRLIIQSPALWMKVGLPLAALVDLFPRLRALQFVVKASLVDVTQAE